MANPVTNDMLMMLIGDDNKPIVAESQSFLGKDDFIKDFKRDDQDGARFFDVLDFSLDLSLHPDDSGDSKKNQSTIALGKGGKLVSQGPSSGSGGFDNWLGGASDTNSKSQTEPISITKELDWASPTLFEMCGKGKPFQKAVLVQRKAAGLSGGNRADFGFVRFEFTNVLVTQVTWSLQESVLTETFRFICRKILVQYRAQNEDGSPSEVNPGTWKFGAS